MNQLPKRHAPIREGVLIAVLGVVGLFATPTLAAEALNPDADEILRSMSKFARRHEDLQRVGRH